jgi:methylglutaconyl-CoA hydratase
MILTGRRVSGAEAYFLSLADRLVEVTPKDSEQEAQWKQLIQEAQQAGTAGEQDPKAAAAKKQLDSEIMARARPLVLAEAYRLASEICEGGPVAVRAALQAVSEPSEMVENAMYDRVVITDDRNEALNAFAEKRKAQFKGRW